MATSLIGGLIANSHDAASITACDINNEQLTQLQNQFRIKVSNDAPASAADADIVVLAVKPQIMREVCEGLSGLRVNPDQ